jgi:dTDP-4-amino-4,6-dideoxygalactose transaminase
MKILYISDNIYHHMIPLANSLARLVGEDNFKYAVLKPEEKFRISMGFSRDDINQTWVIPAFKNKECLMMFEQWFYEADVVLFSSRDLFKMANQRIKNANFYDRHFKEINEIIIPPRPKNFKIVYHLYIVFAKNRDALLKHCLKKGIEAKVHYPIPIYRQEALNFLGYKKGDFPVTDEHAKKIITFPCDQHLSLKEMKYVISVVKGFYN